MWNVMQRSTVEPHGSLGQREGARVSVSVYVRLSFYVYIYLPIMLL